MANIISNDHSAALANNKSSRAEAKGGNGQAQGQGQVQNDAAPGQDDAVTVSRAAQVLSESQANRGEGVIQSADHAAQVAQGLKGLFAGNSGQALAAQANNISPDLLDLLKTG